MSFTLELQEIIQDFIMSSCSGWFYCEEWLYSLRKDEKGNAKGAGLE